MNQPTRKVAPDNLVIEFSGDCELWTYLRPIEGFHVRLNHGDDYRISAIWSDGATFTPIDENGQPNDEPPRILSWEEIEHLYIY